MNVCAFAGCGRPARGDHGLCNGHRQQAAKGKALTALAPHGLPLIERLILGTLKMPNGCIVWQLYTNRKGYGEIGVGPPTRETALTHRVSYELFVGPVPDDLCVLHNCPGGDNPSCINPAHLWLGTRPDNNADMRAKQRHAFGQRSGGARLSEADVYAIRARRAAGDSQPSIAADYGIVQATVSRITTKNTWRHLR